MHDTTDAWYTRLHAARCGCRDALGELLDQCRAYLLALANAGLASDLRAKAGASDLVQDSLLEAQLDFGTFAGRSKEEWRAWLRGILHHNLANHTRHFRATAKRQLDLELPDVAATQVPRASAPSPSADAIRHEEEELLARAFEALPEPYRQVIVWRSREGRPFAEIGRLLDRSPDAARMLWGRAVEELRRLVEESR